MARWWTQRRLRTAGLLFLPGLYFAGFLTWSSFAWWQDLGFVDPGVARYLSAGVIFGLLLGLAFVIQWGIESLVRPLVLRRATAPTRGRRVALGLTNAASKLLGIPLAVGAFTVLGVMFQFISQNGLLNMLLSLLITVPAAGFEGWLVGHTLDDVDLRRVRAAWAKARRRSTNRETELPVETRGPLRNAPLTLATSFVTVLWILSIVLMIDIESEFGGGAPRRAVFDLQSEQMSEPMFQALTGHNRTNATHGVVRSTELNVYFEDANSFLVRLPWRDQDKTPLFAVSRNIVTSVEWLEKP